MLKLKLWPPDVKSSLFKQDPSAGKDWRQEEKATTEDKMVRLSGHESEHALGDSERQGSLGLQSMGSQRGGHGSVTDSGNSCVSIHVALPARSLRGTAGGPHDASTFSTCPFVICILNKWTSLVAQMVQHLLQCRNISWRRKRQPTPVFLPGKSPGRGSLAGYSPWGRKESDTTERLHFLFTLHKCGVYWMYPALKCR